MTLQNNPAAVMPTGMLPPLASSYQCTDHRYVVDSHPLHPRQGASCGAH